jgi:hypothetical protein
MSSVILKEVSYDLYKGDGKVERTSGSSSLKSLVNLYTVTENSANDCGPSDVRAQLYVAVSPQRE